MTDKSLVNLVKRKYTNSADNTYRKQKATIIYKYSETQLFIMLVLSSPFPPKPMLKIVVSLQYPKTKLSLPSTTLPKRRGEIRLNSNAVSVIFANDCLRNLWNFREIRFREILKFLNFIFHYFQVYLCFLWCGCIDNPPCICPAGESIFENTPDTFPSVARGD